MTSPVVTYNNDDEKSSGRMQFILPSKLSSPPDPTNSALEIKHRDPAVYAVSTFAGSYDHKESVAKKDELVEILKKDKITMCEPLEWEFYRYNPPWTLPFMRTNEIAIKVERDQFEK